MQHLVSSYPLGTAGFQLIQSSINIITIERKSSLDLAGIGFAKKKEEFRRSFGKIKRLIQKSTVDKSALVKRRLFQAMAPWFCAIDH
jgi:hypothetical protein